MAHAGLEGLIKDRLGILLVAGSSFGSEFIADQDSRAAAKNASPALTTTETVGVHGLLDQQQFARRRRLRLRACRQESCA